ncbi:MAG: molybdopterin molybdotransferase MoeA [Actinomycetaceae bacterium]|nr:molybdopterin molybdotransferase MoeA [Actinomycetaceae bacterium]
MISVDDYFHQVTSLTHTLPTRILPIEKALGCVLACDIHARYAVPPFTNSSMDGFAMRSQDTPETPPFSLPVAGDIPAGDSTEYVCEAGQAWRIMTGARLPEGADCVVKVEDTDQPAGIAPLPSEVQIHRVPCAQQFVRHQGEDVHVGDMVMRAGTVLTPSALSAIVSVGHADVQVYARPRVTVISTGSELRAPGEPLEGAQIPDSNATLLQGLLARDDCELVGMKRCADTAVSFRKVLLEAAQHSDIIITSGGVSAGAYDFVKAVGKQVDVAFHRVAMQPGKPQGCGVLQARDGHRVIVTTLPGNPVSVFVSYHMFVRPVIAALTGRDANNVHHRLAATAAQGWRSVSGKRQFVPVQLNDPQHAGETPLATPTHVLGSKSHLVVSLTFANALAVIPEDVDLVEQWSIIDVIRV